ncbi:MAG: response regulator, partial [Oscillospiraceae bacterium]|nr:response regulator [Oscillospiraceae bacterium]
LNSADIENLLGSESETVRLVGQILKNCKANSEYDLMKYKLAGDALRIGHWDMDVVHEDPVNSMNSFKYSQKFRDILGYDDENDFPNVLSSWSDRLHPDEFIRVMSAFEDHLNDYTGKTPFDISYRIRLKNGEYRVLHTVGMTVRNSAGIPLRTAGAVEDITDALNQTEIREKSLDNLKAILLSIDAIILVTVPETGEILFINNKHKELFDTVGDENGRHCYEFLHGRTQRCPYCPYHKIQEKPGIAVHWESHSSYTNRIFDMTAMLIDWTDGKKAHLEFGVDVTEIKRIEKKLLHREEMLAALNSAALVLLSRNEKTFEKVMAEGARIIAGIANIDRMSVSRNIEKADDLHASQVYRWSKKSGSYIDVRPELQNSPYSRHIPRWKDVLKMGLCINGPVRFMPEADILKQFGCVSVLAVPVFNEGDFWGFVLFENLTEEHEFTDDETDILRSASFMLANVLIRDSEAKEIRDSYTYAKLMFDANPLGCILWDTDHRLIDCNDAITELFELNSKSELTENFLDCCTEYQPDGKRSDQKLNEVLNIAFDKGEYEFECIHRTLSGIQIPAEITLRKIQHKGSYVLAGYVRDLREQKLMMSEIEKQSIFLKEANDMLSILLQTSLDTFDIDIVNAIGILGQMIDVDRVTVWKNFSDMDGKLYCCRINEWSAPESEFLSDAVLVYETYYEETLPEWLEILSKKECVNGPVKSLSENEKNILLPQKTVSVLVVPIFLKNKFWGYLSFDDCQRERVFTEDEKSILTSVSELVADALIRNEMEEELRTIAITLEYALNEVQKASLAKSEFLSHMSHEMRTPMNAIIGMTSIGQSSETVQEKDYAFNKIDNASKHLLGVINDVLDMAKIEANKLDLLSEEFVFASTVKNTVDVISFRVGQRRQSLYIDIDSNIPYSLIGDGQRLAQVITNLLSNAVKFTPEEGKIRLVARLLSEENGICVIEISVIDNGIGLTEEQKTRLFNSFEQADTGTARKYGGTGLGLSISKRIAELMGGDIRVKSELGKGSEFIFTAVFEHGSDAKNSKDASDVQIQTDFDFSGYSVLLAEDIEINREIVAGLLKPLNLTVSFAEDGQQAVEIFKKSPHKYDIIFMDLQMPIMDGFEATVHIRKLDTPYAAEIPIVAMTANVFREDIERCLEAGMNAHIGKPIIIDEVIAVLKQYLNKTNTV